MSHLKKKNIKVDFIPKDSNERVIEDLRFVVSGVQYFFNSQHLLYDLGKDARAFYDYLCEKMNGDNKVTIDEDLKLAFVEHLYKITKKKRLSSASMSTYVRKLLQLGLILSMGITRNAFYVVNPKYAYKGSQIKREKLLKKLIQTKGAQGESLFGLLNLPEEELLNNTGSL